MRPETRLPEDPGDMEAGDVQSFIVYIVDIVDAVFSDWQRGSICNSFHCEKLFSR